MITPDLQQERARQMAGETITVADDDRVQFGVPDAPDVALLMRIQAEAGDDALTDDEWSALQASQQRAVSAGGHYANLAESLADNDLSKIANDVLDWVRWDEESRAPWYEIEKRGIRALGVTPDTDGGAPFEGASKVVHPLFAEAVAQFSARSIDSVWPAGGPAKTAVMGARNDEMNEQAKRVEQFLNYQYLDLLPDAFEQTDQMLVRLPVSGSVFIKLHATPIDGVCRDIVEPANFIVPYRATSLRTAPRYTERMLKGRNEVKKLQAVGFYRDVELQRPYEDGSDESHKRTVTDEIEAAEGRENISQDADDQRHTLYECYCELDLPGHEDIGKTGKQTGVALPYIVTVDRDSNKVLSIYRNWRKSDTRKQRVVHHIHYRYMPGLGFYGYGLYHWIGGLTNAATGALRALLDAAQFANLPGGYRAKDVGMPSGKLTISPGQWPEVDVNADDLRKAFFPLPYKEPSATLYNLLGTLDGLARRFASTTEAMVGEGAQNVPVGTMLARIEQGTKIYTAIQKRIHESMRHEFKLISWLNSIWLPDEYPYAVQGEDRVALKRDFDQRVDVMPASDPNMASNVQRYYMSQAVLELAASAPDLYDRRAVHKRALESLKQENIDELLPDPAKSVMRYDPVTENAMAGVGRPIKSFMEQDHAAHVTVHQSALSQMPPDDPAAAVLSAHIREHMAHAYLVQMSQATGVMFQMPEDGGAEIPPEVEMQIAHAAAQAVQQMQAEQQPPPDPDVMKAEAEIARKDQTAQADIVRKDTVAQADISRDDAIAQADADRAAAQESESATVW